MARYLTAYSLKGKEYLSRMGCYEAQTQPIQAEESSAPAGFETWIGLKVTFVGIISPSDIILHILR